MKIKDQIVELLEKSKGEHLSGEEIANQLHVSRNAVWKAVKSLQKEGYDIKAVTNKGYCLSKKTDILSQPGIFKYLNEDLVNLQIEVHKTIDSTNSYLKQLATNLAPEGTVIISEEQTAGRGRLGRSFFSPANTGIYLSVLLRPEKTYKHTALLTTLSAVCACEAIEVVSGMKTKIKWVNDIFIDEKKVCGILTEAAFNMEINELEYVVIGVGINVFSPDNDFPDEIKNIATSIFGSTQKDVRNQLVAEFLNRLFIQYKKKDDKSFITEYKKRSFLNGKDVLVNEGTQHYNATVLGIDDHCNLLIRKGDGQEKALSTGEVSILYKKDEI
jgi:BirA family biotin operon repressor/biotin-[acetyl-CoA-carboxylase] ligase